MKRIAVAFLALVVLTPALADQTPQEQAALDHARDLSLAFQRATRLIAPSVVFVASTQRQRADDGDVFGRFFGPRDRGGRVVRGQGSGFVVREDGHILTNNHVVAGATAVRVFLANGREYDADIVGTDVETDLAVIKIDADGLEAARFGDSDTAEVGQWVLAVGNPFGLQNTVTAGIISAKGRPSMELAYYGNLIQTDAAINPGNSGGPLVNLNGEVIGVNNAITTQTGGAMGIGFAIPANMASSVLQSLLDHGRVVHGWIGVTMEEMTAQRVERLGYDGDGVIVTNLWEDGPADTAGLRVDDVITAIDGRSIQNMSQLQNTIARSAPGTPIELGVFRSGKRTRVKVSLGERPPLEELLASQASDRLYLRELGLTAQTVTPEIARQSRLTSERGVLVVQVEPGGYADDVSIRHGDIILSFGDHRIDDVSDLRSVLDDIDIDAPVTIRIRRGGTTLELNVEVDS
ncbi:MAG: trypsin-like peptidase domain-containing protein [Planctomycetota bacterium]|jgi:serine protease Do